MAQRLTGLQVNEVSTVDKGANKKRFLILKAADGPPERGAPHGNTITRLQQRLRKAAGHSGPTTEVDEMTAEQIQKAIADGASQALGPINERIAKLEAALAADDTSEAEGPAPVEEAETQPGPTAPTAEDIAKMVSDGVTEAMKPLADRIEKLESVEGVRQSGSDEAGAHQVAKNAGGFWEGSHLLM